MQRLALDVSRPHIDQTTICKPYTGPLHFAGRAQGRNRCRETFWENSMWAPQNSEQHKFSATLFLSRGAAPGQPRHLCFRARLDDFSLLQLNSVFLGNFVQLFASKLLLAVLQEHWLPHEKTFQVPVVPRPKAAIVHCRGFSTPCQTPLGI